jgi:CheY-like chemotaxis protein
MPDIPTVLLIEDTNADRKLFSLLLEERVRCRVVAMPDAIAAAAWLRDHRPDAIHLDIMLPEVSGWEFVMALRKDASMNDIPIIAISAGGLDHPGAFECLDLTLYQILKPVDPDSYVRMMAAVLSGKEYDGPARRRFSSAPPSSR